MWIAEQGRRRPQADGTALVGRVTLPGDPAAVYLDGERRELPVYGPGGYIWRPAKDQQVLVLRYYRGMTQMNVARVLGVSQVQVSRLERRALERLRQEMT